MFRPFYYNIKLLSHQLQVIGQTGARGHTVTSHVETVTGPDRTYVLFHTVRRDLVMKLVHVALHHVQVSLPHCSTGSSRETDSCSLAPCSSKSSTLFDGL